MHHIVTYCKHTDTGNRSSETINYRSDVVRRFRDYYQVLKTFVMSQEVGDSLVSVHLSFSTSVTVVGFVVVTLLIVVKVSRCTGEDTKEPVDAPIP